MTSECSAHEVAAMGEACLSAGEFESAVTYYTHALQILPSLPRAQVNLGVAQLHLGNLPTAREALKLATKSEPSSVEAWANLGAVHHHIGDWEQAVDAFETALALDANIADIHSNLGASYSALGNVAQARHHLEQSVALSPHSAPVYVNLGNFHTKQGNYDAAKAAFEKAISLEPENTDAWCNLSICFKESSRFLDAVNAAWAAHRLNPNEAHAYAAMGTALLNVAGDLSHSDIAAATDALLLETDISEALDVHHRMALAWLYAAHKHDPKNTDVIRNIASAYDLAGDLQRAYDWFLRLLALCPDDSFGLSRLVDITLALCDWQSYDSFKNRLLSLVAHQIDNGREISCDVINLVALSNSNEIAFQVSQRKAQHAWKHLSDARQRASFKFAPRRNDKIRLGYLLPYTRFTSMTQALADIVASHDRDRFEVFGYCVQKAEPDRFEKSFRRKFDAFREVSETIPERAAQVIHADGIDVLVDTTGHTAISCLPILAMRPAPVQAHYLGYGLTTGADYVDYLITDETFTPPQLAAYCSERLVYLPYSFLPTNRQAIDDATITRTNCGLPESGIVFCNFNQPAKFEPTSFSLWMRILKSVPGSVLWLGDWNEATRNNLRREAHARDVPADRLIFADIVPHARHLQRLRLADLALDSLFHGGGVTSTDALRAGVPLLTCAGETPQSRLGASLLTALEMPELVTDSHDAFTNLGITLALDPDRLGGLRQKLYDRQLNGPFFDQNRYVRDLELALEAMWASRDSVTDDTPIYTSSCWQG